LLQVVQDYEFYYIFAGAVMVVRVMKLSVTFNNISVMSWWSVLLVEETEVPGENRRPASNH
jgi:hypothetical protein